MHASGYQQDECHGGEAKTSEETFQGESISRFIDFIKDLVTTNGCASLLDYGCGKGEQYTWRCVPNPANPDTPLTLAEHWGIKSDAIHTYEPAITDKSHDIPQVDIVISTDVLEHCHLADIPWIVEEIFQKARKAVFVNIASYPARALLPNGENAHITVRPGTWWAGLFHAIALRYPHIDYLLSVEEQIEDKDARIGYRIFSKTPENVKNPSANPSVFLNPIEASISAQQMYFIRDQTFSF